MEARRLTGWAAAIECLFDRGLELFAASPPIERRAPVERRVFVLLCVIGPSVVRRMEELGLEARQRQTVDPSPPLFVSPIGKSNQ